MCKKEKGEVWISAETDVPSANNVIISLQYKNVKIRDLVRLFNAGRFIRGVQENLGKTKNQNPDFCLTLDCFEHARDLALVPPEKYKKASNIFWTHMLRGVEGECYDMGNHHLTVVFIPENQKKVQEIFDYVQVKLKMGPKD